MIDVLPGGSPRSGSRPKPIKISPLRTKEKIIVGIKGSKMTMFKRNAASATMQMDLSTN